MNVSGQCAIVTGGGSGLGAGAAHVLAAAGAKVAVIDVNLDAAQATAADVGGIALACDVTDPVGVGSVVEDIKAQLGVPRICVNCAGIATGERIVGRDGPLELEAFARVININLIGTFNVLRLVAAQMVASDPLDDIGERGVIINTASVAAYEGQIGQAAYSASKGGIVSLTLPAAREFAQFGVRVLTIAPGIMGTPMLGAMPSEVQEALAASIPFPKRLGSPQEFGRLVLHMAENQLLNGEVVRLDGAIRLAPK